MLEKEGKQEISKINQQKIILKTSGTHFHNGETRFQKAETRFQNAKTALSRIFFARTGMDSAQKKPVDC